MNNISEKTLTAAELKKREEVAKALERKEPGIDMAKKMAIATSVAKKVAEEKEVSELDKSTVQSYQTKARDAVKKLRKRGIFDPDHTAAEKAKIANKDKGLARASAKIAKAEAPSKEDLKAKLKDLHQKFDPEYQQSDDHSVYTKHAAIHSKIKDIKKQLGEENVEELSIETLSSYAGKARKEGADSTKKGARSKNLEKALTHFRKSAKRHVGAAKAEDKARTKIVQKSWNESLEEAIVVHTHKTDSGKEYQVLARKNNREFVIQSKKKDGSWRTHDSVGSAQRAKQLVTTGRYDLNEAQKVQTVEITVPALIRLCEIARENVNGDTDLHEFIEEMIKSSNGIIDSQSLEDIEGDGDNDEDDMSESFVVLNHNKKQVHVAYSENAAKKKAEELSKSTGKPHTSTFKREAVVQVKEGEIVSADKKVGADGRLYPRSKKKLGDKTGSLTGMKS